MIDTSEKSAVYDCKAFYLTDVWHWETVISGTKGIYRLIEVKPITHYVPTNSLIFFFSQTQTLHFTTTHLNPFSYKLWPTLMGKIPPATKMFVQNPLPLGRRTNVWMFAEKFHTVSCMVAKTSQSMKLRHCSSLPKCLWASTSPQQQHTDKPNHVKAPLQPIRPISRQTERAIGSDRQ